MAGFTAAPAVDRRMGQLEIIEPGLAMFHGFANVAFAYGRGEILAADTSSVRFGALAVQEIRKHSQEPFRYLIYTHGHGDHAFGTGAFLADAKARGDQPPEVWAHAAVAARFKRYSLTSRWQGHINRVQFGIDLPPEQLFPERSFFYADHTYETRADLSLAGEPVELHHGMGETDDLTWVWMPERRVAMVGDLIVSSLPNTGNPNKVQRYTLEWAEALEAIAALKPRWVLPGHGPIYGPGACLELLDDTARAVRIIHDEVVRRLNAGQWPIEIVEANLALPAELAAKPYLAPVYGCVPFVVRDVLRRYAGWWSGEPSQMLPAPRHERAADLLALCGRDQMIERARRLEREGHLQRALALAEVVLNALPEDSEVRELNAAILDRLAAVEVSFIARNFFIGAARELRRQSRA